MAKDMITLYELVGAEGRSFSPNVWRTRMALAHKNLPCQTVPLRFSDIATILDGKQKTVPVISDSGRIVADSWAIAFRWRGGTRSDAVRPELDGRLAASRRDRSHTLGHLFAAS
jgi:glutathione S-transferase